VLGSFGDPLKVLIDGAEIPLNAAAPRGIGCLGKELFKLLFAFTQELCFLSQIRRRARAIVEIPNLSARVSNVKVD
jgi:hypothetical protein